MFFFNSVSVRSYSPGLSGIQGPLRAIQDPPPREDHPNVLKEKSIQDSYDTWFT